jgi:type II secretory pathway pseudopilin PulG
MSLVEVLVGMALFSVLGVLLLGLALSTSRVTEGTRDRTAVNEESRSAMERIARELRQASAIDSVVLPAGAGPGTTSFTFWTDFDGDGVRSTSAGDPEVLTYRWEPASEQLTLTAHDGGQTQPQPVLAAHVTAFVADLRSSRWEYDANADGKTTWQELDAVGAPVGNGNGFADQPELANIDLLGVTLTVEDAGGSSTYRTLIDLRNRS